MRKLQIVSDLHIETRSDQRKFKWVNNSADIIILAGDICDYFTQHRLAEMLKHESFVGKDIIYVPGNHEFYRAPDVSLVLPELKTALEQGPAPVPVRVSYMDTHVIDGTFYICATLWSDLSNPISAIYAKDWLNDFRIPGLTVDWYNAQHQDHKAFIKRSLEYAHFHGYKSVVVTHHSPSLQSIHSTYRDSPFNDCFSTDLEDLLYEDYSPALWIHGHTHHSFDYTVGFTRVICNPYGYPNEASGKGFNSSLIVEV